MYIDLERIPKDRPAAVVIPNDECAEMFLDAMKLSYPERVKSWDKAYTYYGKNTCFIPHFEMHGGMTYWDVESARRNKYTIIEWEYICPVADLTIEPSDCDISLLLW